MEKIGFIILRHVNNGLTNKYWIHSYECIRKFYPENQIIIIDDNSNYKYILNKETLYKTTIINSEYIGRGELLPYYYYLNNKLFETAVIIHDSVFINKYIDFTVDKYKLIWDFKHNWDITKDEINIIKILKDHNLLKFYENKKLWKGCFGGMSIIKHDYLLLINEKYNISKLLDVIKTRHDRCRFERVIACLLQINSKEKCLLGDIHSYCKWGITFKEKDKFLNLPIIKVWTGR
jgi:hypothetical protein